MWKGTHEDELIKAFENCLSNAYTHAQYMKKDTQEDELIKAFEDCLAAPPPDLTLVDTVIYGESRERGRQIGEGGGSKEEGYFVLRQRKERQREGERDKHAGCLSVFVRACKTILTFVALYVCISNARKVPPAFGSTEVTWDPVDVEHEREKMKSRDKQVLLSMILPVLALVQLSFV